MLSFSKFKILVIMIPCIWGLFVSVPHLKYSVVERYNDAKVGLELGSVLTADQERDLKSWPFWLSSKIVNLGLDLRGGAHLLVEVSVEDVYDERLNSLWLEIRTALVDLRDELGSIKRLQTQKDFFEIEIGNSTAINVAVEAISKINRPVISAISMNGKTFEVQKKGNLTLNISD